MQQFLKLSFSVLGLVFCVSLLSAQSSVTETAPSENRSPSSNTTIETAPIPEATAILSWMCMARAFTKKYEALGVSRAEAKNKALELCKKTNSEIQCHLDSCEGPASGEPQYLGWTCTLRPFTKNFTATGTTLQEAKLKSRKLCRESNSEMFCENPSCNEG